MYDYATTTLQREILTELNTLNTNIEGISSTLSLLALMIALIIVLDFIRRTFWRR